MRWKTVPVGADVVTLLVLCSLTMLTSTFSSSSVSTVFACIQFAHATWVICSLKGNISPRWRDNR